MKLIKRRYLKYMKKNNKLYILWDKFYNHFRTQDRVKSIFYSSGLLVVIIIIAILTKSYHNYDGKYINQISEEDKVCKMLLEDIHDFKKKYNGQGGGGSDIDLQVVIYKIKQGDSLWQISEKTGLHIDTLLSMNNLVNVHVIQPDQKVYIPNKDGILYKVQDGETLESIAEDFKVEKSDILNVNELTEESLEAGKDVFIPNGKFNLEKRISLLGRFILPVIGRISSHFGKRRNPVTGKKGFHYGIDIANVTGAPIRAAESGRVIFRGRKGGYGKLVIIKHSNGYSTRYGHMSRYAVKHGQWVKQRQVVGYIGSTGHVTGPHCHFEIRKYGRPLNPYYLMRLSQK